MALERRPKAKDSPLARPFGRQISEASNAHAVRKAAVDRGFDEAIRRASSLVSSSATERRPGLFFEVEIRTRLPGGVADDEALGVLIDSPRAASKAVAEAAN